MSTAKDQMTKLLDQLMGQNRDGESHVCACVCVSEYIKLKDIRYNIG
jgi:hypothetical protein